MTNRHLQVQREIPQLAALVFEAKNESQFATMAHLAARIVEITDEVAVLPLQLFARFWWADAVRMLGRDDEAMPIYTCIISQATDPANSTILGDQLTQWHIARSFESLVQCAANSPTSTVEQLAAVLDDGMAWLDAIGRPQWAAGLRLLRGDLHRRKRDFAGARREYEAALALKQRNPDGPGYTLADHRMSLASLLNDDDVGQPRAAIALCQEVLADPTIISWDRFRAYGNLSFAHADLGEHDAALAAASERLVQARQMQGHSPLVAAYATLEYVHRKAGRGAAAATAVALQLFWTIRLRDGESSYGALCDAVEVRLLQARLALGLAPEGDLPDAAPAVADRRAAVHYVESVYRLIDRAMLSARAWDRTAGVSARQDTLAKHAASADRLLELLNATNQPGAAEEEPVDRR